MSDLKVNTVKTDAITNQAGTSAINIDDGGRATFPKARVPSFHIFRGTNVSVADSTFFTIPFDQNEFLHDWSLNTSTGVLTCGTDAAGIYVLTAQCRMETGSDFNARLQIRLNDSPIMTSYMRTEYYDKFQVHTLKEISAGNTLSVVFHQASGGAVNVGTTDNGNNNTFFGYRISK